MATPSPSQSQQMTAAENAAARNALLTTGVHEYIKVGTFGPFSPGQTARMKLINIGVLTEVIARITATVDNSGTAAATPGPTAPYSLIETATFFDYDNTPRVRATGPQLYMRSSVQQGALYDVAYGATPEGGNVSSLVQVPTAVGTGTLSFDITIPVAIHPESDLTGAILAQTVAGEQFVQMSFPSTIVGSAANNLYTAGTVAVSNIYVELVQRVIQPQLQAGAKSLVLPQLDLLTVYELNGGQITTSNLSVGQEKLIDYPNNRTVLGVYWSYLNGGSFNSNASDLSKVRQIANGSQPLRDLDPQILLHEMRRTLKGDVFPAHYFMLSRLVPIYTQLYGNVQLGVTPSSVGSGSQIDFSFESLYPKGAVLPGVASGA